MSDKRREKIVEFLALIEFQTETGLLIKESEGVDPLLDDELSQRGVVVAHDWPEVVEGFAKNQPVCLKLDSSLSRELYDIVMQYNRRKGVVQVLDQITNELRMVTFDPEMVYFLIVASPEDLKAIGATVDLMESFEFVGRV